MASDAARGPTRPRLRLIKSQRRTIRTEPEVTAPDGGDGSPVSNAQLAVLLVIVAETMIFGGLIGALMVLRGEASFWPPPGMPKLPILVTWINTFVLMGSAFTMYRSVRAARNNSPPGFLLWLQTTGVLGLAFLAIQGSEWIRLIAQGLRISSGTYGAMFYTLIGLHGAHVAAAVIWLGIVAMIASRRQYGPASVRAVELCAMYWYFVCAIWPVLFVVVYLT